MKLNYREYGSGQPLIILHGLFGSSDNWQTLGKAFAEHYHVFLVDQRNHGHSPWSEEFGYEEMSEDLYEFITEKGLNDVHLIGHSMGGKTVMKFCTDHGDLVEKLVVVDIGPKAYPPHHDTIFKALLSLDFSIIKSRKEAEKHLSKYIEDIGIKQFLLKNLYWKEKGQLALRMNIEVLSKTIPKIIDDLELDVVFHDTLFIRGMKSNYIVEDDFAEIEHLFPNVEIASFENSGHWVHAEEPERFMKKIIKFLSQ